MLTSVANPSPKLDPVVEALRKLLPPTLKIVDVAARSGLRLRYWLKVLSPENVLLSLRSVEDAAETVMEPPTLEFVPLIVPNEPVSLLVPIEVVATTWPLASVERSALVRLGNQTVPKVRRDEEACCGVRTGVRVGESVKGLLPENVLLSPRSVEEAAVPVLIQAPFTEKQPLEMLIPPPVERKEVVALVMFRRPFTANCEPGEDVPIPTHPFELIVSAETDEVAVAVELAKYKLLLIARIVHALLAGFVSTSAN